MTDAETCNLSDPICLSETHLARRWNKSTRTLQRWRAQGYGPAHIRLRGGVALLPGRCAGLRSPIAPRRI